jgi:hypothetical protein
MAGAGGLVQNDRADEPLDGGVIQEGLEEFERMSLKEDQCTGYTMSRICSVVLF